MQKSIESVAEDTDRSLLAEALSAWMDGQALPPGVSQEELAQWLLDDPEAQQKWRLWHAGADCLQLAQFHEERAPGHSVVGSPAWSAYLQHRLSDAAVMDSPDSVSAPLSVQANPVVTISRPAANDPVWRWKNGCRVCVTDRSGPGVLEPDGAIIGANGEPFIGSRA